MRHFNLFMPLFFLAFIIGCDQGSLLETDAPVESSAAAPVQQLLAGKTAVEVPAGSVDALADAIAEAGEGGVVLLKAGLHHESNTVEIGFTVSIVGEAGATLVSDTHPATTTGIMKPALYVHGASDVVIHGLKILPEGEIGGTAVFIENAFRVQVRQNIIEEHEFGVVIQQGDQASITNNTIAASSGWLTGDIGVAEGILLVNGDLVQIQGNTVSNAFLGIFASDRKGLLEENELIGNYIGVILCNVPNEVPTPGGDVVGSETPATDWILRGNHAHDNLDIGYLVIDGASENLLINNAGGANGRYDIELAGGSERFGFFTPTSLNSKVVTGKFDDLIIKDCGVDDQINGDATMVDTDADPCN